jgi:hypothetical protein
MNMPIEKIHHITVQHTPPDLRLFLPENFGGKL